MAQQWANKIANWANYTPVCSRALVARAEQAAFFRLAEVSEPFAQNSRKALLSLCVRKERNRRIGQRVPLGCNLLRIFIVCDYFKVLCDGLVVDCVGNFCEFLVGSFHRHIICNLDWLEIHVFFYK
jgi:hypothetical protein